VIETFVAHTFAHRMEIVHHEGSLDSGRVQIAVSLVFQIALFIFVAIAFLGSNWALYVGAVVFFAPLARVAVHRFDTKEPLGDQVGSRRGS